MAEFTGIFAPDFLFRNSVHAGLIVGVTCPLVGLYFVMRRMVFLGVALPQISGAGIALAFFLHGMEIHFLPHETEEHWMALVGSLTLTAAAIVLLTLFERGRGEGAPEHRIAVAYIVASAVTMLLIAANPHGETHVLSLLKGDLVAMADRDLAVLAAGYALVVAVLVTCHRELLLVSYDRDMARVLGRRVAAWDATLFILIGVTISLGVMTVGPLVVFAFLVLPPLAALRLVRGMIPLSITAAAIGAATALLGFHASYRYDLPLGPTDAVLAAVALAAAHLAGRLRRRCS